MPRIAVERRSAAIDCPSLETAAAFSVTSAIAGLVSGRPSIPVMPSAVVPPPSKNGSASAVRPSAATDAARTSRRSISNGSSVTVAPVSRARSANHRPDSSSTAVAVRWNPCPSYSATTRARRDSTSSSAASGASRDAAIAAPASRRNRPRVMRVLWITAGVYAPAARGPRLFRLQRLHRIDARGLKRREVAREHGGADEPDRHRSVRYRIGCLDVEQQRRHQPRHREGDRQAARDADRVASRRPWPTNSRVTSPRFAPSAMRMPISRVRCDTEYEMTP